MKDPTIIDIATYQAIPLFSELSKDELSKVVAFSLIKQFKKSAHIFLEGDHYAGFYVVLQGKGNPLKLPAL